MPSTSNEGTPRQLGCLVLALIIIVVFVAGTCFGLGVDDINDWFQ